TEAWEALTAYAGRRRRRLAQLVGGEAGDVHEVVRILRRMERSLDRLVAVEERELERVPADPAPAGGGPGAPAPAGATVVEAAPVTAQASRSNGHHDGQDGAVPPPADVPLTAPVAELELGADRLDRELSAMRATLIRRYAAVERRLASAGSG